MKLSQNKSRSVRDTHDKYEWYFKYKFPFSAYRNLYMKRVLSLFSQVPLSRANRENEVFQHLGAPRVFTHSNGKRKRT